MPTNLPPNVELVYVAFNEWEVYYHKKIIGMIYWSRFNVWVAYKGNTTDTTLMTRIGEFNTQLEAISTLIGENKNV